MNEFQHTNTDPRWGADDRNIKAEQIFQTLQHHSKHNLSQMQWLDLGCGSGGISAYIAPQVRQMIGVDPEPWARWQDWEQAHTNLRFIQASVDTLTLPPASVDVIICNQVYEHVPDPQALIHLIHRVLKPGGLVYFAGPNLLFPIEPHVFWPFVHWLPRPFAIRLMKALGSKHADDLDAYSTHYWQLTGWLTRDFKVKNALPVLVKQVIPGPKGGLPYAMLRYIPAWLVRALTPLSPGFVFVLEKPQ
jgi:2-polyprenyl-3-methyl-5-hydroxy-6-metoxy-1,4-benzoquinol methylase